MPPPAATICPERFPSTLSSGARHSSKNDSAPYPPAAVPQTIEYSTSGSGAADGAGFGANATTGSTLAADATAELAASGGASLVLRSGASPLRHAANPNATAAANGGNRSVGKAARWPDWKRSRHVTEIP